MIQVQGSNNALKPALCSDSHPMPKAPSVGLSNPCLAPQSPQPKGLLLGSDKEGQMCLFVTGHYPPWLNEVMCPVTSICTEFMFLAGS